MSFEATLAAADRGALRILGIPVRYWPGGGSPVTVTGIFNAPYVGAIAGMAEVVSTGPAVFLRLADLPSDPAEDDPILTIDGTDYRVRTPQKDGLGGVLLMLKEAA